MLSAAYLCIGYPDGIGCARGLNEYFGCWQPSLRSILCRWSHDNLQTRVHIHYIISATKFATHWQEYCGPRWEAQPGGYLFIHADWCVCFKTSAL